MTRAPVCPVCGSTAVTPDASNGGAGRNVCHCGHRAPVRDFYSEQQRIGRVLRTGRQSPHFIDDMNWMDRPGTVTYGGPDADVPVYDPRKLYMQQPIPDPEGYRTDKHTGNLRPAKPFELQRNERPPAPIRQYKDDD